jgi:ribosome-associated protein
MNPLDITKTILNVAQDKKATRIFIQDLTGVSDIADVQFICSGENDRQTRAIAEGIEEVLAKNFNLKPIAIEGKQTGQWVLLDYGTVLVHIFFSPVRDYYALEQLWPKAKILDPAQLSVATIG